jgi:hypothetical protein
LKPRHIIDEKLVKTIVPKLFFFIICLLHTYTIQLKIQFYKHTNTDFLLYNDHLMSELRAQEFDIACWEQYNLHGLHQAIFHALGIEHFCLTSPVPMGITSWDLYGLKRIVSHVPGGI